MVVRPLDDRTYCLRSPIWGFGESCTYDCSRHHFGSTKCVMKLTALIYIFIKLQPFGYSLKWRLFEAQFGVFGRCTWRLRIRPCDSPSPIGYYEFMIDIMV